jgi:hypothetical protein
MVALPLTRLMPLLKPKAKAFRPSIVPQEASYRGKISKKKISLSAKVRVHVLKPGGVVWKLGGFGGVITELRVNRKPVAPFRDSLGLYSVLLPKGGHEVTWVYQLAIGKPRAGKHSLFLNLPAVAKATMQLTFAGNGWELSTKPASRIKTTAGKKQTVFTLQLPGTGGLRLEWKGKRITRKVKNRFRAEVETLVTLREGLLSGKSTLYYEVLTGSLRTVQFKLSKQVEVLGVTGKNVTEWFQLKQDAKWRWISVQLSGAVAEKLSLQVRFEQTRLTTSKPVSLPALGIPDAEVFSGVLGVLARADTEVSHHKASQARSLDVRNLSQRIRKQSDRPILLAYQFDNAKHAVQVKVTKHKRLKVLSILVNSANFQTVVTKHGREVIRALYNVTNNQRQFMQVDIPKGAKLLGTFVAGRPVQPALSSHQPKSLASLPAMTTRYLIPLIRSKQGQNKRSFQVELFLTRKQRKFKNRGSLFLTLPSTPLEIMSFHWHLYFPETFPVLWTAGNVRQGWHRFLRRLERNVRRDLRSATPNLWAGADVRKRMQLNVYSSLGLKSRFARPKRFSRRRGKWKGQRSYRSNFDNSRYQVRLQLPLVGKSYYFRGHLLRNKAPHVRIWYVHQNVLSGWFWIVLLCSLLLGFLFTQGLFHKKGIRWIRLISIVVIWAGFCVSGYIMPLTFLGLLKGALFGFWAACLHRFVFTPAEDFRFGGGYLALARWIAVFFTFLMLMVDHVGSQITCLLFATPMYPALLLKKASTDNTTEEAQPTEAQTNEGGEA